MMIKQIINITLISLLIPGSLYARSQVRGVGSSTVYPFITKAAEEFGRNGAYKTPIIESTGTGGGFKLFCKAIGTKTPDIANASREIKESERKLCAKNGITNISEIKLGYDGIALATSNDSQNYKLTTKQIFLALAAHIPQNGELVKNPYKKWSDIDKSLPETKISVYGPPSTSGTRDAFVELVMQKSCVKKIAEFKAKYPNKKTRKKACSEIREDGAYIDAGENDNMIVQKLTASKNTLGIFGYSFLENNSDRVKGSIINGYKATFENIASGKYPISRSLFVYVKNDHYSKVSSLKTFIKELVSEESMGEEGYLTERGLIPLSREEFKSVQKATLKNFKKN